MKWEEDLAPYQEPKLIVWPIVAAVLFLLVSGIFMAWMSSAPTLHLATRTNTELVPGDN